MRVKTQAPDIYKAAIYKAAIYKAAIEVADLHDVNYQRSAILFASVGGSATMALILGSAGRLM